MPVHAAVVEELEKLCGGRLLGVLVVGFATMAELAERRGRTQESDAVDGRVELLVDVAREHKPHRAVPYHREEVLGVRESARAADAGRDRGMVQTQHNVGLGPGQLAA